MNADKATAIVFCGLTFLMAYLAQDALSTIGNIEACYEHHKVIEHQVNNSGKLECKLSQDGNVSHWAITEVE